MKPSQQKALKERVGRLERENQRLAEKLAALKKERQILQKDLRAIRKLLSEIPSAVVLVQGKDIVLANERAWRQLGYKEEDLLNLDFLSLVHPRSHEHFNAIRQNWLSGKPVPDQFEIYLRNKSGDSLCCEVYWKKIRYLRRTAFLFSMMALDQRKRDEKRLGQSQKNKALTRMASGLNKDFSRALRIINKNFEGFQGMGSTANKKMIRSLRKIEAVVEMGDFISQQLNCLAKLENKQSDVVLFDPKKALLDAVAITRPKWKGNGEGHANVKTYLRTLSPIQGVPSEIRDAFICMILNAVDAVPDGGEVYLTSEENSGFAWIYIQDSGVGIPEDIKDKIFDPFFTTKGAGPAGLGLSLAYAIINRHGGEIEVISQEGQGATFIVKLPLSQKPITSKTKRVTGRVRDSRILIISERSVAIDVLIQTLVSKGGKVTASCACVEGLKLLRRRKFDLVVADIDTPDFEITGIVQKIKQMDKCLPVALVNTGESGRSFQELQALEADLMINRPMEMNRVLTLVSKIMATKTASE